jgi:hypothetical protein
MGINAARFKVQGLLFKDSEMTMLRIADGRLRIALSFGGFVRGIQSPVHNNCGTANAYRRYSRPQTRSGQQKESK